jgi:hypothetical protein
MQALGALLLPFGESLEKGLPEEAVGCLKKIMVERGKLNECYVWLNRKYMDPKFHSMAARPIHLGE